MITIDAAGSDDLAAVRSLVAAAELPLDGLGEVTTRFFVARAGDEIVGAVAVERHGAHALLRSLVVDPGVRGRGVGAALADQAEAHAREVGLDGVYLLTETVPGFFSARGYRTIGRDSAPEPVMGSVEWSEACGESAVPMMLTTR